MDNKKMRLRLKSERARLIKELDELKSNLSTSDERRERSPFGKREEEATEALELEKRLVMEKRIRERLGEVEHALSKCDRNTYGLCDSCGQPIDPARLQALPEANLCLKCKAQTGRRASG